jgi:hypothetical protein
LLVGESAEVFGRDPTGGYWYIRSPRSVNRFCWVWGEYAALSGPVQFLPVFTPPPTPTATATPTPTATPMPSPAFNAKYAGLDSCGGNWWVEVDLKNTGSIAFRSMEIRVVDTVTKVNLTSLVNGFTDLDGCLNTTKKDVLESGSAFTISAPEFDYDPSGNKLRVTIILCSKTGQKGRCESKRIVFTP